jgi:localization factor PodJL
MSFKVPWHVKGVRPEARDSARAAARQAGVSVGEWLNSMILDSIGDMEAPGYTGERHPPVNAMPERDERRAGHAPAYTRRDLEREPHADRAYGEQGRYPDARHAPPRPPAATIQQTTQHLANAIARLDQRMDQIIQERRMAGAAARPRQPAPPPQPPSPPASPSSPSPNTSINQALSDLGRERVRAASGDWDSSIDQAVAEISQRIRELDGETANHPRSEPAVRKVDPTPATVQAPAHAAQPDTFANLNRQLQQITAQIQALDVNRTGEAIAALREELSEIARTLVDASPRRAIEALEGEMRALSIQLDATRRAANAPEFASLERGLAEVRDAVRSLAPAESLAGAMDAIRVLAEKIDVMAAMPQDNTAMQQLETAIAGLRGIASHAASSDALAALTSEVRAIAAKVDNELPGMARGTAILNSLEQRIATIADAIEQVRAAGKTAPPADFDRAMQSLGDRIEQLYSACDGHADIARLQERLDRLGEKFDASESRLRSLDTIELGVKEVFTFLDDVRNKIAAPSIPSTPAPAFDPAILAQIESRFEQISQRFDISDSRLRSLDAIERGIKDLYTSFDDLRRKSEAASAASAPAFDAGAFEQLNRRIDGLAEKIDTAIARTESLGTIERGIAAVLGQLREARTEPAQVAPQAAAETPRVAATPERAPETVQSSPSIVPAGFAAATPPSEDSKHDPIGDVVDRLAMIEMGMQGGAALADAAAQARMDALAAPGAAAPAAAPPRAPAPPVIHPPRLSSSATVVAHDQPLEPGSGKPRPDLANIILPGAPSSPSSTLVMPEAIAAATAAGRIAASKAVLESVTPPATEPEPKQNYIVAARRAAQAAAQSASAADPRAAANPPAKSSGIGRHIKSALVGISVLVILASVIHLIVNYFESRTPPAETPKPQSSVTAPDKLSQAQPIDPDDPERELIVKFIRPDDPSGGKAGVLPEPPAGQPGAARGALLGAENAPATPVAPKIIQVPAAPSAPAASGKPRPTPDHTGSVAPTKLTAPSDALFERQALARTASLPASIGSQTLVAAAEGGDPTAAYEVALRFTEGRGVPANLTEAAAWFELAARAGVVPALFRLGGHYEKGLGVKKDLARARDLYVAAANSGNAKAMHNLAVIYAEGLDGKPDYATAVGWFRKAAGYGIPDSQFNLGVLYARGIGVEQNLAESFKWFALAALLGDQDAAQKRDDVAKRLDPQTLNAVRQAVQNWTAQQQPDEAVAVRAPAGGWDQGAPPPPATRKPKPGSKV